MKVFAAILAAGRGERFGSDKLLTTFAGRPLWYSSYDRLASHPRVDAVGILASSSNIEEIRSLAHDALLVELGGEDRQATSRRAVELCPERYDIVLIHDAARPDVSRDLISRVIDAIERTGAAAPGLPVTDTLRLREDPSMREGYTLLDRSRAVLMQTPQGARRELLLRAHAQATQTYTDEMALLEAAGIPWELVEGEQANRKVTTQEDLRLSRANILPVETRTGIGYDIHAFSTKPGRNLFLGGVLFEGEQGLEGHSDADVVLHAAVDAFLGAAALGDIGQHFPNTDPHWKDKPSTDFLSHARGLLAQAGWHPVHLDVAIMAERPKIMPRAMDMRRHIAKVIGVEIDQVSIKATTHEGLGAIGRGEGIAALATATITRLPF